MQVLVTIEDMTDELVDQLWSMHRFLKEKTPREHLDPAQQDVGQVAAFAAEVEAEAKGEVTIDQVRAALTLVAERIGMGRPIQIVKQHGAASVSKLDPAKYGDVVDDCEKALSEA